MAREEYLQIRRQIELERADQLNKSWATLFKKPSLRKRLILGFGTQFIAQSTGISCNSHQSKAPTDQVCIGVLVVNNYQILLYKSLGITGSLPLLLNALYNGLAATMNFVNSLFLDRLGRIRIMLIGLVRTIHLLLYGRVADVCLDRLRLFSDLLHSHGGHIQRHDQPSRQRLWSLLPLSVCFFLWWQHGRHELRILQ